MFCSKCGRRIPDDADICSACGARVAAPNKPSDAPNAEPGTSLPNAPQGVSGLAIASLILSILGIFALGIPSLVGLALGIVAITQIRRNPSTLKGYGMAVAGIVISIVVMIAIPIALTPVFLRALEKAQSIAVRTQSATAPTQSETCLHNLKQLGNAMMMYAQDNDGRMPPADSWCECMELYVYDGRSVMVCPKAPGVDYGYAYNSALDCVSLDVMEEPSSTAAVFDAKGNGRNRHGGAELVDSRHDQTFASAFADGHAGRCRAVDPMVRWKPRLR